MRPIRSTSALVTLTLALTLSACAHREKSPVAPPPQPTTTEKCGDGTPMQVRFYNVGQALSVLVTFPDNTHWLVDAGTGMSGGKQKLLNNLRRDLNGSAIDLMWITHQHADHMNAASAILDEFTVKTYVDNGEDVEARPAKAAGIRLAATDKLPTPAAPVKITPYLPSGHVSSCPSNPNNCSIGLRIDYCSSSILFVGDAEEDEEAMLPRNQSVTVLQVGHHGSPTSSSEPFIAAIKPKYAVISAGQPMKGTNATYCHPSAKTVKTLNSTVLAGSTKELKTFTDNPKKKCQGSTEADWIMSPTNEHIWATERDDDVVLGTVGNGAFVRCLSNDTQTACAAIKR
jgi:competence protein ComEC